MVETNLPGLTEDVGAAIGTVFMATTDWIVRYWTDRIGREPTTGELEPPTRAARQGSSSVELISPIGSGRVDIVGVSHASNPARNRATVRPNR